MFLWLFDFVTPSNIFFRSFSILVYNNTIISLRLIVYYLIIANSFASYQTINDSPSRDNCKIYLIDIALRVTKFHCTSFSGLRAVEERSIGGILCPHA